MSGPTLKRGWPVVPERARRLWRVWAGPPYERAARWLVLAGGALLFLHSAATVEVVYTLRGSYLLLAAACGVGLPFVVRGWGRVPPLIRRLALALVLVYLLAMAFGETSVLSSSGRGSGYRGYAYMIDLVFGLALVGLVAGLWQSTWQMTRLFRALVVGAGLASAYGVYQWFAQRFGLPFQDLNNAVNSDGISYGTLSQGTGLFGGERIKGTFVEPRFFGMYLASMLPLAVAVAERRGRWGQLATVTAVLVVAALVLTSSAPSWGAVLAAASVGLVLAAVARGRVVLAAAAGSALVLACVMGALLVAYPGALAAATGRPDAELKITTEFRVGNWSRVVDLWSNRPVTGFGPGQSSVKLAKHPHDNPHVIVLGTAQGVWSAALLDGGALAFSCWVLLLSTSLYFGGRAVLWRPGDRLALGLFVAATAAVLGNQVDGDRLDLRVWLLLSMLVAVGGVAGRDAGPRGPQPARDTT